METPEAGVALGYKIDNILSEERIRMFQVSLMGFRHLPHTLSILFSIIKFSAKYQRYNFASPEHLKETENFYSSIFVRAFPTACGVLRPLRTKNPLKPRLLLFLPHGAHQLSSQKTCRGGGTLLTFGIKVIKAPCCEAACPGARCWTKVLQLPRSKESCILLY